MNIKFKIIIVMMLLISGGLIMAQNDHIASVEVKQYSNFDSDTVTLTPVDSLVFSNLTIQFLQLDPNAVIHVKAGSRVGSSSGFTASYTVAYLKNSFVVRSADGKNVSQLSGDQMQFVFSCAPTRKSHYKYWSVWLDLPGGSTTTVSYIIP